MKHLKVGDKAPDFSSVDENGNSVSLSDFSGKKLVLYFYPKDSTPGCTMQACNLRDNYDTLIKDGYAVLGVSADSQKRHQNFIAKKQLPFSLLADETKEVIQAYGVWGEKKFMGKVYDGIHRMTFIIDEKGVISEIIEKVKTKDHFNQIIGS